MTPDELSTLLPQLPPGTEVWMVRIRLPGAAPGDGDHLDALPPQAAAATEEDPVERLKVGPTARRSGIPERELRRAIQGEFLAHGTKEGGRDARAHLITDDALEAYRIEREEIRLGRKPAPEDWPGPVDVSYEVSHED